ncbi:hypothetical protein BC830DRAFT_488140 [Chytriomyces sp. MP71]|nr:hypothetical protein BC830DRAFT_488140 [Chytriomyces sp. MP71]
MFKARSFALFHPPQPRPSPPFFYHFAASNVRRYSPSSGLPSPLPWKHKESPYDILGVSRTADAKEIKKRYFEVCIYLQWADPLPCTATFSLPHYESQLSFINHPDKNLEKTPAVQEKLSREFMAIQEAYEVLKDANLRQEYNLYGGSRNVGEWVRRDSANRAYSGSGAFRMQEEGTRERL